MSSHDTASDETTSKDTATADRMEVASLVAARTVRTAQRRLGSAGGEVRNRVLTRLAGLLRDNKEAVLAANRRDLEAAEAARLAAPLLARLELTPAKLETLVGGVETLAAASDPVGRVLRHTELDDGLELRQVTSPIGVLLIIFESRPGAAIQFGSLAIRSGNGVLLKGGSECPGAVPASETDGATEYGDLILAVRTVDSLEEAVDRIHRHGSAHTDAIVSEDGNARRRFLDQVDSASVFANASPRFADGFRYGLGAEVGISTGRIHARGPVGVDGLLTTRWLLEGSGQGASDYGPGKRSFSHRRLSIDPES